MDRFILHGTALNDLPFQGGAWVTLPGHGKAPRVSPNVAAYAEAVAENLPARFALMGHSLGGMVAMQVAANHPARCRALVLIDAPLWLPAFLAPRIGRHVAQVAARVPGRVISSLVVAGRTAQPSLRPAIRQSIQNTPVRGLGDAIEACCRFDARPLLPQLTMPVLGLFGRKSILTNRAQREALSACPQAEIVMMNGGHMLQYELPNEFDACVNTFLAAQS